jgi:predicted GNAT superfamily acetyltransferase
MKTQQEVIIRDLKRIDELEEMVRLLCRVWNTDSHEDLINASTLRAMVDAECYVVGMFLGEGAGATMVGAAVAIRGPEHLHSHIVGVLPEHQGHGLGYRLKKHEADWAQEQRFKRIRWTYDPLVRRNAYFNLAKLNSQVIEYAESYYGELNDGLNDGDETDRLVIDWEYGTGEPMKVSAQRDPDQWDFTAEPDAVLAVEDGAYWLVPTPANIEALRQSNPARARAWRFGVRAGFHKAEANGYAVVGFSPDGWYVLRRP